MKTMSDIIAFNKANANLALRFGQDIFLASDATRGDMSEMEYLAARQMDILATRTLGLDAYMDGNKLDAVLFPGRFGSNIPAKAGYPSVQVPGGMVRAPGAKPPPDYPFGVTFTGRAWSEPVLLRLAYAFEQATKARRPPPGMPALSDAVRAGTQRANSGVIFCTSPRVRGEVPEAALLCRRCAMLPLSAKACTVRQSPGTWAR